MIDVSEMLRGSPNGVLATRDGEGVKTRVFQSLFVDGNRVYFCTSSEKQAYAQLQQSPSVSFCAYPPDFARIVSINGKAVFDEDIALKARALDENPPIQGIYGTPDNPVFKLFYIDIESVQTFSFSEGPKTYAV